MTSRHLFTVKSHHNRAGRKTVASLLSLLIMLLTVLTGCQSAESGSQATKQQLSENRVVRLSTTTSIYDSGLLSVLEKAFEDRTGYRLDVVANGSGAAIRLGETGDADVLLVHARADEERFIEAGHGVARLPFMYNYFMIVGPADDKAGISQCDNATAAFAAIAASRQPFVSRGDDSGTHIAEMKIWAAAGIEPSGDWYHSVGKGMESCLIMAGELNACILTDKATWLVTKEQHGLESLLGESADMKNVYSVIAVNPEKHAAINGAGARAWIDFLFSDEAASLIGAFGKDQYGEALFFYDGLARK